MRWKESPPVVPGDTRIRSKFLLLPRFVGNEWRWLERARWKEQARIVCRPNKTGITLRVVEWFPEEWCD